MKGNNQDTSSNPANGKAGSTNSVTNAGSPR